MSEPQTFPSQQETSYRQAAPKVWPVVAFTTFFGVFGAISAFSRAEDAKRSGHPTKPYWVAWGVTMAATAAVAALLLTLFFVVLSTVASPVRGAGTSGDTYVSWGQTYTRDAATAEPVNESTYVAKYLVGTIAPHGYTIMNAECQQLSMDRYQCRLATTHDPYTQVYRLKSDRTAIAIDPDGSTSKTRVPPTTTVYTLPITHSCKELQASRGLSRAEMDSYWRAIGRPDDMDDDRDGYPCETIYGNVN